MDLISMSHIGLRYPENYSVLQTDAPSRYIIRYHVLLLIKFGQAHNSDWYTLQTNPI